MKIKVMRNTQIKPMIIPSFRRDNCSGERRLQCMKRYTRFKKNHSQLQLKNLTSKCKFVECHDYLFHEIYRVHHQIDFLARIYRHVLNDLCRGSANLLLCLNPSLFEKFIFFNTLFHSQTVESRRRDCKLYLK